MRRLGLRLTGCFAIAGLVAAAAAQQVPAKPAAIDQKALLDRVRHAYYVPLDRGVQGFACTVDFDWSGVLERASAHKIPAKEPTLVALQSANVTVTDDLMKGAAVKAEFPKGNPAAGSPVASREKILDNLVTAGLAGWNTFLSNRVFPLEGTKYRFEGTSSGYRLTLEGGTFFSILELDSELRITHGESHLNGTTTEFTPEFDTSSHGWLITSLKTVTTQSVSGAAEGKAESSSTTAEGENASFTYSYQFAEDVLVPKQVTVLYADGPEMQYGLKDCTLMRTTAERKATGR